MPRRKSSKEEYKKRLRDDTIRQIRERREKGKKKPKLLEPESKSGALKDIGKRKTKSPLKAPVEQKGGEPDEGKAAEPEPVSSSSIGLGSWGYNNQSTSGSTPAPIGASGGGGPGPRRVRGRGPDKARQTLSNMPRGPYEVPEGMNYMEEQFILYGHDLGNYKPTPIVGTDHMSSVYHNSDTLTPDEYSYFFNWQHPLIPGGKKFARNRPKGTSHLYDETHLHHNVLAEKDRKIEFSRIHGGVVQNRTRWDEAPVFLSSY